MMGFDKVAVLADSACSGIGTGMDPDGAGTGIATDWPLPWELDVSGGAAVSLRPRRSSRSPRNGTVLR
jgi:hypothetical protein